MILFCKYPATSGASLDIITRRDYLVLLYPSPPQFHSTTAERNLRSRMDIYTRYGPQRDRMPTTAAQRIRLQREGSV